MVEMKYVQSSNIEAIGYDSEAQELHVRFIASGSYIYSGVPEHVYEEFMNAPSHGSYLNRMIKGVYQFQKA